MGLREDIFAQAVFIIERITYIEGFSPCVPRFMKLVGMAASWEGVSEFRFFSSHSYSAMLMIL